VTWYYYQRDIKGGGVHST